jgi:hypothetical protein
MGGFSGSCVVSVFGFWFLVFGFGFLVLRSPFLVFGFGFCSRQRIHQELQTDNQKQKT